MVAPDDVADKADRENGEHHRFIGEDRLAGESRQDVRRYAHAGEDRDVHLRVTEEPEQVLPQERRSALMAYQLIAHNEAAGNKKAGSTDAIEQQQNAARKEHGERQKR